jgi:hypothetical protein
MEYIKKMMNIKSYKIKTVNILFSAIIACSVLSSCYTISPNVLIKMDKNLNSNSNIQVDFLGCKSKDLKEIKKNGYTYYWNLNNYKYSNNITENLFYGPELPWKQVLLENNSVWEKWKHEGCEYLVIIANWPVYLPAAKKNWLYFMKFPEYYWFNFWSDKNIYLNINKYGISKEARK